MRDKLFYRVGARGTQERGKSEETTGKTFEVWRPKMVYDPSTNYFKLKVLIKYRDSSFCTPNLSPLLVNNKRNLRSFIKLLFQRHSTADVLERTPKL